MNNRELATLIIAAVIALAIGAFAARNRGVRDSLKGVLAALVAPKVIGPMFAFGGWVFALIVLSKRVDLWDDGLIFPAVLWATTAGLGLIFKLASRRAGEPFFAPAILRTFHLTVVVEVVVGLFAFSLIVEFVLLIVASFLAMLSQVAGSDPKYEPAKKLVDFLLGLIGLAIIALTVISLVTGWDDLDTGHVLRQLVLPLWLTLGSIPFLYVLALWIGYEQAFMRINLASDDRAGRLRAKLAIVAALHGRAAKANAFIGGWAHQMTEAPGVTAAWRIGRDFQHTEQARAAEKREAADRLERYADVEGTDDEGRQLDQREFKETREALQSLATAQMGWFHQNGRYRPDLLDFFPFRHLPDEHGIEMSVSDDGQRWFAWRRTVTGWCFGIGASAEPPDQWLYDGADPPTGLPGIDSGWGDQFAIEMANW